MDPIRLEHRGSNSGTARVCMIIIKCIAIAVQNHFELQKCEPKSENIIKSSGSPITEYPITQIL